MHGIELMPSISTSFAHFSWKCPSLHEEACFRDYKVLRMLAVWHVPLGSKA
jgi:hypothetical protein